MPWVLNRLDNNSSPLHIISGIFNSIYHLQFRFLLYFIILNSKYSFLSHTYAPMFSFIKNALNKTEIDAEQEKRKSMFVQTLEIVVKKKGDLKFD